MRKLSAAVVLFIGMFLVSEASARKEISIGEPAPDFNLPVYNQQKNLKLSDHKGKVVLLGFVDTCEPCRMQAQAMETVRQYYGDKVSVIAIVYEDASGTAELYGRLNPKPKYPLLLDPRHTTEDTFGLWGDPQVAIIDKNGKIAFKNYITDAKTLIKEIDKLQ